MQLENRKTLVTGAAGGIGQAIVARLQAEGAMVAASDLDLASSTANVLIPGDLSDIGYAKVWPRRRMMRSVGSTLW